MSKLNDLTSRDAVLQAMVEFDRLGRTDFISKYGFRPARSYFVIHDGRSYDSKAIVGAFRYFFYRKVKPALSARKPHDLRVIELRRRRNGSPSYQFYHRFCEPDFFADCENAAE